MEYQIVCVDYQYDFCREGGKYYHLRPCHDFIDNTLVPWLIDNKISIWEIVCDYSLPRPHETNEWCVPGAWGYTSAIPEQIVANRWVKAMDSPEWIRSQSGQSPHQDPAALDKWLTNIQSPNIVLFGLTFECCVMNTAIQLHNRGYNVYILQEATDICEPSRADVKDILFATSHREYAKSMSWQEFQGIYIKN